MRSCAKQLTIRILIERCKPRMDVNISNEMSAFTDFRRWLWSDWGKPDFLTRMGIPRIVINFLSFLLAFIALYYITLRYSATGDREKLRRFVLNPFILTSYAALSIAILTREFLSCKYNVKGRALEKFMRENWREPFVRDSMFALASTFLLFLIGFLVYRFQLK
jgi:hypothetical protein